jgi:predicted aminopeptidase
MNRASALFSTRAMAAAIIAILTTLTLAGCDVRYLTRAALEEARLLRSRRPISVELKRQDLPVSERAKLETVLAVRKFAADRLGLNVGDSYRTVAQVDRGAVVWVVMAAPRDSLTPYTWWFPIVGNVPYRGFFNEDLARAKAASMEAAGFDTYVRPAIAFSSLGFFNDPLLSNLLKLDQVELAGVIIHELFHRTFFLASDITFDESAATWVGNRGAVDFFSATDGPNSVRASMARDIYQSDMKFAAFLLQEQARLLALYGSGLPRDEILKRRVKLFAEISSDYAKLKPTLSGLEQFDLDQHQPNNALMVNYLIYFHDLPSFEAIERQYRGDTRAAIQAIIAAARSEPGDPFHAIRLAPLSAHGAGTASRSPATIDALR